ncbi:MAG: NifB/NifX family molybdenum-iron cluster-binding protein [Bacteroidales bacterium]
MKIAIAANENHIQSPIDVHFGRCDWFCLYDHETGKFEFIENDFRHHTEQAGCDAAKMLADKNVKMVVAGRFGSKVVGIFRNKHIQMITLEKSLTIYEFVNRIK